jgi:hypothetical protein
MNQSKAMNQSKDSWESTSEIKTSKKKYFFSGAKEKEKKKAEMAAVVATPLKSAAGLLSLLQEPSPALRQRALESLRAHADLFWPEIADSLSTLEALAEDAAAQPDEVRLGPFFFFGGGAFFSGFCYLLRLGVVSAHLSSITIPSPPTYIQTIYLGE